MSRPWGSFEWWRRLSSEERLGLADDIQAVCRIAIPVVALAAVIMVLAFGMTGVTLSVVAVIASIVAYALGEAIKTWEHGREVFRRDQHDEPDE